MPKGPFPLPCIDQVVDSTSGCKVLSFLDTYSGYHQIAMKESDQPATSFITPFGSYWYVMMWFGLKNTRATYQRCMIKCFGNLIGRTVEAYVDDIMVKTRWSEGLVPDLREMFDKLKANGIKLNPENASLVFPKACCSVSWSLNKESRLIQKRLPPSRIWGLYGTSRVSRVMGCLASLSLFVTRLE